MICPVCYCDYSELHKLFTCESFDDSYLYKDIVIKKCNNCGHQFNEITSKELRNLQKYYEEEYAPINLSSEDKAGDRPGSNNKATIERYEQLFTFMCRYFNPDSRVLDVGCAMGGFMKYLEERGALDVCGIEPIESYVKKANNSDINLGNVYSIPFPDNSFDIVILDQVLEHLANPRLAMKEIKRVLDKGGLCCISVPDANRYYNDYFYFMREHLQHFNLTGLKLLAEASGFELLNFRESENDMIGDLPLPNLTIMLKVTGTIYCWGIGREFMYYYPHTRLRNLDLILIDDTPEKQNKTFKGMKIHSSDILKEADKDSFLIITAMVHEDVLKRKAKELGYKGEIISV